MAVRLNPYPGGSTNGARSGRPGDHLPGAHRRGEGDGDQARAFGVLADRARGKRLLRRSARCRRQRGEPGRADSDAARSDRHDLPPLRRALSAGDARTRRLLHQQRSVPRRTARTRRVHLLAHLLRQSAGRIQRHRRPPPRPRRRRARSEHGGRRRPSGGPHLSTEPLQRESRLERRSAGTARARQRTGAGEDHRGLQCAVRGQRSGREARDRALREVRSGQGDGGDVGVARLLRAAHARRDRRGPRRRVPRRGPARQRRG